MKIIYLQTAWSDGIEEPTLEQSLEILGEIYQKSENQLAYFWLETDKNTNLMFNNSELIQLSKGEEIIWENLSASYEDQIKILTDFFKQQT